MDSYRIKSMLIFYFFFYSICYLNAQNITGIWSGNYGKTLLVTRPTNVIMEIEFINDSIVRGATHVDYPRKQYEHYSISGKYNKRDSTIRFTEDSTLGLKIGAFTSNCLGIYTMKLVECSDTLMKFAGKWSDKNRGILHCPTSTVWFTKKIESLKTKTLLTPVDKSISRSTNIQSVIEIHTTEMDSIKVEVYDNGIIDGDSVSVFYNDSILINNRPINSKPITFFISLKKQRTINKIKLVAENLGKIPPCTAFMIITTKKKKYEVNLSSDFLNNAVAELYLVEDW